MSIVPLREASKLNLSIIFACILAITANLVVIGSKGYSVSAQEPLDSENIVFIPLVLKPYSTVITKETDWPQVQYDSQRTGYTPQTVGTDFKLLWKREFQPEKIYTQVQAIVSGGRTFVGTEMGNMYAFEAKSGNQAWVYYVGAPILSSVAASDGKIFFGAMDGAVYALNIADGSLVWKTQLSRRLGFSTSPVLAEKKVMLGGRNGIFYGLDQNSGNVLWQYETGAPILQTAAWNDGRAIFGAMDLRLYAVDTDNGGLLWKSQVIDGMAFKDYWPVIYQGKVYVRPMGRGGLGVNGGPSVTDVSVQQNRLANYAANPGGSTKNMFVFEEETGQEAAAVIHYDYQTQHGATAPPCVDRDGYLVVPAPNPLPEPWGVNGSGWGRLDVNSRILVDVLYDGNIPTRYPFPGYGNGDENMSVSCTGNLIFTVHHGDGASIHTHGAFDLDTRQWTKMKKEITNRQLLSNTQGGGSSPASIANGVVYHVSQHHLIARSTEEQ